MVLLPADVNRSYQDKPYAEKVPHYAKQNAYAASLTASMYKHQPKFAAFLKDKKLLFKAYAEFGTKEHDERRELVLALANQVWSPDRLKEYLAEHHRPARKSHPLADGPHPVPEFGPGKGPGPASTGRTSPGLAGVGRTRAAGSPRTGSPSGR